MIKYTISTETAVREAQEGRSPMLNRVALPDLNETDTWERVGRRHIRPCDLLGGGALREIPCIGEFDRLLSPDEAVVEAAKHVCFRNAQADEAAEAWVAEPRRRTPSVSCLVQTDDAEAEEVRISYVEAYVHEPSIPNRNHLSERVARLVEEALVAATVACKEETAEARRVALLGVPKLVAARKTELQTKRDVEVARQVIRDKRRAWLVVTAPQWAPASEAGLLSDSGVEAEVADMLLPTLAGALGGSELLRGGADILGEGESVEDCALPRALVQVATEARGVLVAMAGFDLLRYEPEIVRHKGQEARTVFVALRHADSCTEVLGRLVLDRGEA